MSSGALTLNYLPKPNANCSLHDNNRRTTTYHPSIWKDYFLQYASQSKDLDYKTDPQIEELKKEVTKMLASIAEKPLLAKLDLIDSICRLGLHYHFECEIDKIMRQIHKSYVKNGEITIEDNNPRSIALLFRLLRQQGFRVSSNVFNQFKDTHGNFIESLVTNVEGMLSLYEASYTRIHGENILEEALKFSSTHLECIDIRQLSPFLAAQVSRSLRQPLHHGLPRWEARHYISIYQQDPNQNEVLLTLAKLDFNFLQKLHKKEVGNLTRWWEDLDVTGKLPYARDRFVECCAWILSAYFEPKYHQARILLTKTIALLSLIDDTYDNYGTIHELQLFTKAIERWDACCLDDLPEYMKIIYKALLEAFEEAKQEELKEGRGYSIGYCINEFKKTVKAYMTEAEWFNSNYVPTPEEYLQTCTTSTTYPLIITTSYIGMGDMATEDIFKWVTNEPKIVKASSIICRLMDDIVSSELEQKRGHVASYLECYVKEYDLSREEAIKEAQKRVNDAWKDINEECLMPTKVPMLFLIRPLNMTRFISVMYKK